LLNLEVAEQTAVTESPDLTKYTGIRLDIGCGANKQTGCVGIDIRALEGVDIVHDLQVFPWPLGDESVIQAMSSHVVEHINPADFGFINFMDEVWRILKPGAQFAVSHPYGGSARYYQDPTHVNAITEATWGYFAPNDPYGNGFLWDIYKPKPWAIDKLYAHPYGDIEILLRKITMDEVVR